MGLAFIGVVGGARCSPEEDRVAEETGVELAQRGVVLICGGLDGVMKAAARGARSAGGMTVGILPGDSRAAANAFIGIPVVTGLGEARNAVVVKSSEALIAIGGEYGTLSEIALALKLGLPVVGIDTWSLCRNREQRDDILVARNATEAVERALQAIGKAVLRRGKSTRWK